MRTVALVPISGKPIHLGHWKLIEIASNENDAVIVFVSTSDRTRRGEIGISGSSMKEIWEKHLIDALPPNVVAAFGGSPVKRTYETIGSPAHETEYVIYSDDIDIEKNFPEASIKKYSSNNVKRRPVKRSSTTQVSGSDMRSFIANDDENSFMKHLPPISDDAKREIWKTLKKSR